VQLRGPDGQPLVVEDVFPNVCVRGEMDAAQIVCEPGSPDFSVEFWPGKRYKVDLVITVYGCLVVSATVHRERGTLTGLLGAVPATEAGADALLYELACFEDDPDTLAEALAGVVVMLPELGGRARQVDEMAGRALFAFPDHPGLVAASCHVLSVVATAGLHVVGGYLSARCLTRVLGIQHAAFTAPLSPWAFAHAVAFVAAVAHETASAGPRGQLLACLADLVNCLERTHATLPAMADLVGLCPKLLEFLHEP